MNQTYLERAKREAGTVIKLFQLTIEGRMICPDESEETTFTFRFQNSPYVVIIDGAVSLAGVVQNAHWTPTTALVLRLEKMDAKDCHPILIARAEYTGRHWIRS